REPIAQLLPTRSGPRRRSAVGPAQMCTHERERQLTREELVVGKTRPCQSFRQNVGGIIGSVEKAQRVSERGKTLTRYPTRLLPFGHVRQTCEGCDGGLAYLIETQSLGQWINRFD